MDSLDAAKKAVADFLTEGKFADEAAVATAVTMTDADVQAKLNAAKGASGLNDAAKVKTALGKIDATFAGKSAAVQAALESDARAHLATAADEADAAVAKANTAIAKVAGLAAAIEAYDNAAADATQAGKDAANAATNYTAEAAKYAALNGGAFDGDPAAGGGPDGGSLFEKKTGATAWTLKSGVTEKGKPGVTELLNQFNAKVDADTVKVDADAAKDAAAVALNKFGSTAVTTLGTAITGPVADKDHPTEAEVTAEVAKLKGAIEDVTNFPAGYQVVLDESGAAPVWKIIDADGNDATASALPTSYEATGTIDLTSNAATGDTITLTVNGKDYTFTWGSGGDTDWSDDDDAAADGLTVAIDASTKTNVLISIKSDDAGLALDTIKGEIFDSANSGSGADNDIDGTVTPTGTISDVSTEIDVSVELGALNTFQGLYNAVEADVGTPTLGLYTDLANAKADVKLVEKFSSDFEKAVTAYEAAKADKATLADLNADKADAEAWFTDNGYTTPVDLAKNGTKIATPDDDIFTFSNLKGSDTTTISKFGDKGTDYLYIGDGYTLVDLGSDAITKAVGDASALEVFFKQNGNNVELYVETDAFGGNLATTDHVIQITLSGVKAADIDLADGFIVAG